MPEETAPTSGPNDATNLFPEEAEIAELLEKLRGSEKFRTCRGKLRDWFDLRYLLGDPPPNTLFPDVRELSPTEALARFDQRHGDLRPMLNMLAKLRRDGKAHAFRELKRALEEPGYTMRGEESPVDRRVKGVLMIPEPMKMLRLLRWCWVLHPDNIARHMGHPEVARKSRRGNLPERPELRWLTDQVLVDHPNIRPLFETYLELDVRRDGYPAYLANWVPFEQAVSVALEDRWKHRDITSRNAARALRLKDESLFFGGCTFGYFFPDAAPGDVAKHYGRDEQDDMLLLPFEHPPADLRAYASSVGIFPAHEHSVFRKIWPASVSKGTSGGIGAVLLHDEDMWMRMDDGTRDTRNGFIGRGSSGRIFSHYRYHEQPEAPDPDNVRIVLRFSEE